MLSLDVLGFAADGQCFNAFEDKFVLYMFRKQPSMSALPVLVILHEQRCVSPETKNKQLLTDLSKNTELVVRGV